MVSYKSPQRAALRRPTFGFAGTGADEDNQEAFDCRCSGSEPDV